MWISSSRPDVTWASDSARQQPQQWLCFLLHVTMEDGWQNYFFSFCQVSHFYFCFCWNNISVCRFLLKKRNNFHKTADTSGEDKVTWKPKKKTLLLFLWVLLKANIFNVVRYLTSVSHKGNIWGKNCTFGGDLFQFCAL